MNTLDLTFFIHKMGNYFLAKYTQEPYVFFISSMLALENRTYKAIAFMKSLMQNKKGTGSLLLVVEMKWGLPWWRSG